MHAGFIRAANLNRLPVTAAKVIRKFNNEGIPYRIIGTNALYVFEQYAGVQIAPQHLATMDVDILMDSRQAIKIVSGLNRQSLLGIIKETDKTFKRLSGDKHEFTAINDSGYRIDFITQGQDPMTENEFSAQLDQDDLQPVEIASLKWPISSPKFSGIAFDTKGFPVRIDTIDPRAFALHKWYVSQQPDREPIKRDRDASQARIVASMINQNLLGVSLVSVINKLFPDTIINKAAGDLDF